MPINIEESALNSTVPITVDFSLRLSAWEYDGYTQIPPGEDYNCQMTRVILTKSKHWCYEREYRIVRPEKAGSSLDYPVELLTGIIFGCMMPDIVRELIKQWTEEGHCRVAFFEARPKAAEFGLDIVRVD